MRLPEKYRMSVTVPCRKETAFSLSDARVRIPQTTTTNSAPGTIVSLDRASKKTNNYNSAFENVTLIRTFVDSRFRSEKRVVIYTRDVKIF
jgi:hypothetical protein